MFDTYRKIFCLMLLTYSLSFSFSKHFQISLEWEKSVNSNVDIKIYSFTNPTSHKKASSTTSFCLCSLTFMTLSHQWQFRWEFGKMRLQGGTTPLPCVSWTATWKLVSRLTKVFPRLTETHIHISKNHPRWLNTSSLTDKARVSCTHKVTQDQPQLNEKLLCQICVKHLCWVSER